MLLIILVLLGFVSGQVNITSPNCANVDNLDYVYGLVYYPIGSEVACYEGSEYEPNLSLYPWIWFDVNMCYNGSLVQDYDPINSSLIPAVTACHMMGLNYGDLIECLNNALNNTTPIYYSSSNALSSQFLNGSDSLYFLYYQASTQDTSELCQTFTAWPNGTITEFNFFANVMPTCASLNNYPDSYAINVLVNNLPLHQYGLRKIPTCSYLESLESSAQAISSLLNLFI